MDDFEFEVEAVAPEIIEIRWPKALGKMRSAPYREMADVLEAVEGVDGVEVLRYTAHVRVADHVHTMRRVLLELEECLLGEEQIRHILREIGVTYYGVTILPSVVT